MWRESFVKIKTKSILLDMILYGASVLITYICFLSLAWGSNDTVVVPFTASLFGIYFPSSVFRVRGMVEQRVAEKRQQEEVLQQRRESMDFLRDEPPESFKTRPRDDCLF